MSGLGQYELRLERLASRHYGSTQIRAGPTIARPSLYNTFDVTSGCSPIGRQHTGPDAGQRDVQRREVCRPLYQTRWAPSGSRSRILQLRIVLLYDDGSEELIASDASWRTRRGPIVLSQTYGGEDYRRSARSLAVGISGFRRGEGCARCDAANTGWEPVVVVEGPGGTLAAQNIARRWRVAKTLTAVSRSSAQAGNH